MILTKIRFSKDDIEKYRNVDFKREALNFFTQVSNSMLIDTYYVPSSLRDHYRLLRKEIETFVVGLRYQIESTDFNNVECFESNNVECYEAD